MNHTVEIYQYDEHTIEVRLDGDLNTVWLSQSQLVDLFQRDQSVISRHLRNVFKDGELMRGSNMQKMHSAGSDKPVAFYSLNVIISVGYRVKSPQGVMFRRWATARLKELLLQGYTLNQHRFEQNAAALRQALILIEKTAQSPELTAEAGSGLASLLGNLEQSVFGEPAYPSVESKAALTLLIAESDPKQKEVIIRLVMTMLALPNSAAHCR